MRKYLIYGARILYGFFILSVFYCAVHDRIVQNTRLAFLYSLFFLPVMAGCSIGLKKCSGVFQYTFISIVLSALAYLGMQYLGLIPLDIIILMICCIIIILNYFLARANKKVCWLENPIYWTLAFYLLICIYGNYFKSDSLIQYASFAAGCSYLIVNISVNENIMNHFISDYSNLERLPVQRMRQNNNRMSFLQALITAAVMIAAPYLKLDQLIIQIGKILRNFLRWILSFVNLGEETVLEEAVVQSKAENMFFPTEQGEASLLMKILDWLLEIAGWIVLILFIIGITYFLIRKVMQLYRQFNERTDENGDVVENIMASTKTEDFIHKNQKMENLFLNFSPNTRIRKFYKKRIQKENKEGIYSSWTPQQLEEVVDLSAEKKEKFHVYYEKARYGKEECTKEEMQDMLSL